MSDCVAPNQSPDSLEERLTRALPRLRAHLAGRAGCEPDDVAQEVVARALRYRASFDPSRELWPWLRRMAEHVLHDQHSAEARRPRPVADLDPLDSQDGSAVDARDEVEWLLAQLSGLERDVLLRFHQRAQSVRTIAQELQLPEGTVKSHLSRARRRLAGTRSSEASQ